MTTEARTPKKGDLTRRLANRLLVAIRDDVAAHRRVAEYLHTQETHVIHPTHEAFRAATTALESELERLPFRKGQRDQILGDLGRALGVEGSALTLTSLAERLGEHGQPLLVARDELRAALSDVQRQNRRVAALIRAHRELTRDILSAVLGDGGGADLLGGGTLIDAEV